MYKKCNTTFLHFITPSNDGDPFKKLHWIKPDIIRINTLININALINWANYESQDWESGGGGGGVMSYGKFQKGEC